jgi:hypothetical protein
VPVTVNYGFVAVSPGTAITGVANRQVSGVPTPTELSDYADLATTRHFALMQTAGSAIRQIPAYWEIGGETLSNGGTYHAGSAINLAAGATLTLQGGADDKFHIIAGSTLVTGALSQVVLQGGVQAKNVVWILGSAATLGADSHVKGSILAGTAITFGAGSTLDGCAIAQSAVTFGSGGSVGFA